MGTRLANALVKTSRAVALTVLLNACAAHPWVKPYERDALSDPLLNFRTDALADQQRDKAAEVNRGARGALGLAGDGCGCD